MAEIKYLPVEIDGVEIEETPEGNPLERLLHALDVKLQSQWTAQDVNTGFDEIYDTIQDIESGDRDINQVLTSLVVGQTLISDDGNLLTKAFT
jgi:hypothetical protein